MFYETYTSMDAFKFHQTTPHFKAFAQLKESGAVEDLDIQLCDSINYTGFKKLALV